MLTQISSLIFGFMRNKKVKVLSAYKDRNEDSLKPHGYQNDDDDGVSTHSMITNTESHYSDNSYFDPPLENYQFYYQGAVNRNSLRSGQQQTGFFL